MGRFLEIMTKSTYQESHACLNSCQWHQWEPHWLWKGQVCNWIFLACFHGEWMSVSQSKATLFKCSRPHEEVSNEYNHWLEARPWRIIRPPIDMSCSRVRSMKPCCMVYPTRASSSPCFLFFRTTYRLDRAHTHPAGTQRHTIYLSTVLNDTVHAMPVVVCVGTMDLLSASQATTAFWINTSLRIPSLSLGKSGANICGSKVSQSTLMRDCSTGQHPLASACHREGCHVWVVSVPSRFHFGQNNLHWYHCR